MNSNEMSLQDVLGSGVAGLVLLVLGAGLIGFAIFQGWGFVKSVNWPETEGEVIYSQLTERQRFRDNRRYSVYQPDIRYEYSVEGQSYTHDAINFGQNVCPAEDLCLTVDASSSDRAEAEQYVIDYPPGQSVTVTYNPDNPQEAVLERTMHPGVYIMAALGVVLLLVGTVLMARGD